jgi:hypothetical protein
LEKLRLLVAQIEAREFRHVCNVEIGGLGHDLEMEMVQQPNRRGQKGNDQNQEKNPALAALFSQRPTRLRRNSDAVAFVMQSE